MGVMQASSTITQQIAVSSASPLYSLSLGIFNLAEVRSTGKEVPDQKVTWYVAEKEPK